MEDTITCEQLRQQFNECYTDINKRILILDLRNAEAFNASHLKPGPRDDNDSVTKKMRVINIDPSIVKPVPTVNNIRRYLSDEDDKIFATRRKDASIVVLIDSDTSSLEELKKPNSKVMCMIRALTYLDTETSEKIRCPIKILQGGYRAWCLEYPHWTTNSNWDPDNETRVTKPSSRETTPDHLPAPIQPIVEPIQVPIMPLRPVPIAPSKPVPIPPPVKPIPIPPRNAPGTAVPATPTALNRPPLPRSHSSPNVAQGENSGDELDELSGQVNGFNLQQADKVNNNNHFLPKKPIFDRSLKPLYNIELVNAIKAQLNFGNSYEASGRTQTGLQNLGNTCFMNSVIQCLAYTPALVTYFSCDTYYKHINFESQYGSKGELAIEFGSLIEKINLRRYKYIEPRSFRLAVRKHFGFADNEQQDSHEFMMMLFDKLHHDLNIKHTGIMSTNSNTNGGNQIDLNPEVYWKEHLKMNKSIISELFEGLFMSTLTCSHCGAHSNTYEVFNCLSLPITSSPCHIRECLTNFSNPERIDAPWKCPKCKLERQADKKIVIRKLPKILIIHLKRFSLDGRWRQKLETNVDFPLKDLVLPTTPRGNSYDLYAVVNHYGDLNGGHYTSFCKMENQHWHAFSDRDVSKVEHSGVCSQAAYILFYVTSSQTLY